MNKCAITFMLMLTTTGVAEQPASTNIFSKMYTLVLGEIVATHRPLERFTLALALPNPNRDIGAEFIPVPQDALTEILKRKQEGTIFVPLDKIERYEASKELPNNKEHTVSGWRDVETQEPLRVILARFEWHGNYDIVVWYGVLSGGALSSSGGYYLIRWKDGEWTIIEQTASWIS